MPRTKILIVFSMFLALGVSNSQPANSEIITVGVTGVVDEVSTDGGLELDGSVGIGTIMSGYCSYDLETPDLEPSEYHGEYVLLSISMNIGNYTFTENPTSPNLALFEVGKTDLCYKVHTTDGIVAINGEPQTYYDIGITLFDLGNFSVSGLDDKLPVTFPDLSFFSDRNEFEVTFSDSGIGFNIGGVIDSITVIPEPTTFLLISLGSLALLKKRKA